MRTHPTFWLSFATGILNSYALSQEDMRLRARDKYSFLTLNTGLLYLRSYNANEYTVHPTPGLKFLVHFGITGAIIGTIYCGGHLFGNMLFHSYKKDKME